MIQWTCNSQTNQESTASTRVWQISGLAGGGDGTGSFQGLPNVAPNSCHSTTLPKCYGTNFPVPSDPNGQGFANETAMGWDGNFWPVIGYLSGSFFARGVPTTYTAGSTSYCGAPGRSRGQQLGLLQSIAATGLTASGTGPFTYSQPLYIGRGIPNTWIAAGQTIGVSNLTAAYNFAAGARSTYGVSLAVTKPASTRVVTVTLSGTLPGGPVLIQLPVFLSTGVNSVTGGTYNSSTHTVTANSGATTITITITLAS